MWRLDSEPEPGGKMETITISGRNMLREYLKLRAAGWETVWTGEGKICMKHKTATVLK